MLGVRGQQRTGLVIVPGNHDGVHLGHQALLRTACAYAQSHGLRSAALTFDPHPAALLAPERAPALLTLLPRRGELLRRAGAQEVLVQSFTRETAALSPEAFVDSLCERGMAGIVVGPDFRFGQRRAGDFALLERLGGERGFAVIPEPPFLLDDERVSSTAVRRALTAGDVEHAGRLLGRVHELSGVVVRGDQRGRTLGFPTANVDGEAVLHPADGVYAVVARDLDAPQRVLYRGVANLGPRPTFDAGSSVEVHLFDVDVDLYGRHLRVGFVARLRGGRRFDGPDALRAQIESDCRTARDRLESADEERWAWI